ncbi:MAG: CARDB domain-containing protein, partial [Candidatus Altarchaeum sp.]|nr:CARDB domain-containing protein [Candidatus Altarchaeum sp.]
MVAENLKTGKKDFRLNLRNLSILNLVVVGIIWLSLGVYASPDLTVEDISWNATTINEGDTVKFTATIKNTGTDDLLGQCNWTNIGFFVDGNWVNFYGLGNLFVNDSKNFTMEWQAKAGNHNITVSVDTDNIIFESNETNNNRTEYFSVSSPSLLSDLIIIDIIMPSGNINDGDQIQFNISIKNNGDGNVSYPFLVELYANGNLWINGILVNGINANEVKNVTIIWWNARAGTNNITARADDGNRVTESNESNNELTKTVPFSILFSDLIIENITYSPLSPNAGDLIDVNVIVKNIGNGNTTRYIQNNLYVNGIYVWCNGIDGINANETKIAICIFNAPCYNISITAVTDNRNDVPELNESNNNKTIIINTTCVNVSDLIVTNITFTPSTINGGDVVIFNATIKNNGSANANYFRVWFIDNGISFLNNHYINNLASGASVIVSAQWTATAGNHNITVIADVYDDVLESNETNNNKTQALTVSAQTVFPDIVVENVTFAPNGTVNVGQIISFNITLRNDGNKDTGNFVVGFYIDKNIVSIYTVGNLASGESTILTINWRAINATEARIIADPCNIISELNEKNNNKNLFLNLNVPFPDLIVTDLTFTPTENISPGTQVTFKATVKNIGEGKIVNRNIYVDFYLNSNYVQNSYQYTSLAPGESVNFTTTWSAQSGNYSNLTAKADTWDYITESNETNNDKTIPFMNIPFPDLIVTDLTFTPTENIGLGTRVTFKATVKNIGEGEIVNQYISVDFYLNSNYVQNSYQYTS